MSVRGEILKTNQERNMIVRQQREEAAFKKSSFAKNRLAGLKDEKDYQMSVHKSEIYEYEREAEELEK